MRGFNVRIRYNTLRYLGPFWTKVDCGCGWQRCVNSRSPMWDRQENAVRMACLDLFRAVFQLMETGQDDLPNGLLSGQEDRETQDNRDGDILPVTETAWLRGRVARAANRCRKGERSPDGSRRRPPGSGSGGVAAGSGAQVRSSSYGIGTRALTTLVSARDEMAANRASSVSSLRPVLEQGRPAIAGSGGTDFGGGLAVPPGLDSPDSTAHWQRLDHGKHPGRATAAGTVPEEDRLHARAPSTWK